MTAITPHRTAMSTCSVGARPHHILWKACSQVDWPTRGARRVAAAARAHCRPVHLTQRELRLEICLKRPSWVDMSLRRSLTRRLCQPPPRNTAPQARSSASASIVSTPIRWADRAAVGPPSSQTVLHLLSKKDLPPSASTQSSGSGNICLSLVVRRDLVLFVPAWAGGQPVSLCACTGSIQRRLCPQLVRCQLPQAPGRCAALSRQRPARCTSVQLGIAYQVLPTPCQ